MNKKTVNRNITFFLVALSTLILFVLFLRRTALNSLAISILPSNSVIGNYSFYFFAFLFGLCVYFASKTEKSFAIFAIILLAFFAWLSFTDQTYSPVDESLHFDYINCIIKNGKLVTFDDVRDYEYLNAASNGGNIGAGVNYEAVQAPFYYAVMSLVGVFIPDAYWRMHIIRLMSLLLVIPILLFLRGAILEIRKGKRYKDEELRFIRIGLFVTILNPGYLYRASRISNEIMVCLLISALLYVATKCIMCGYQTKYYWYMAVISALCLLTKSTAIYSYVALGVIAFLQKKVIKAFVCALSSGIIVLPWIVFNYIHYGSLTSMKEHLAFVLPIANPQLVTADIFEGMFSLIPNTWFTGEEMASSAVEMCGGGVLIGLVMALVACAMYRGITEWRKAQNGELALEKASKDDNACLIFGILILACIFMLAVGTIITKINSLRARYIYPVFPALILLLVIMQKHINWNWQKCLTIILIIIVSLANTRAFVTMSDRVYTQYGFFGSQITELNLADITDENWDHGFMINGDYLLIQRDPVKIYNNYELLRNKTVHTLTQEAVINDVKYNNDWVWLGTSIHLNSQENNQTLSVEPSVKLLDR